MKRTTKKALGLVGLATVAALTVIAAGIDTPASATPISGDVTLQYLVIDEGKTHGIIEQPLNGSKTVDNIIPIRVVYSATTTIKYSLTYQDASGQTITVNLPDYTTPEYEGGIHSWNLNLDDYDLGYGTYILHADVYGNGTDSDSIEFTYQPVVTTPATDGKSTVTEDGTVVTSEDGYVDTNIAISSKENPTHGDIYIYDASGNRVTSPITGEPITIPITQGDISSGRISVKLTDYGLTNGQNYKLVYNIYNGSGGLIGSDYINILYQVVIPNVPNTGSSVFAMLNLSKTDFIISSLLALGAITVVAFIIFKKTSRR